MGATEFRIENKEHNCAAIFVSLIPFDLLVRIHSGISFLLVAVNSDRVCRRHCVDCGAHRSD
jgi:hypothetical protein